MIIVTNALFADTVIIIIEQHAICHGDSLYRALTSPDKSEIAMDNHFRKTIIRMSFEAVLNQLKKELHKGGFDVGGITQFHEAKDASGKAIEKYQILNVYILFLYNEMMSIAPFEGIVLPCTISVIETHPGEVAIVPYNATESIVEKIQNPSLQNLAAEVTRRLNLAIHALEKRQTGDPDLVTSWG